MSPEALWVIVEVQRTEDRENVQGQPGPVVRNRSRATPGEPAVRVLGERRTCARHVRLGTQLAAGRYDSRHSTGRSSYFLAMRFVRSRHRSSA